MLCFDCGNDECARVKQNWNMLFVGIVCASACNVNAAIVLSISRARRSSFVQWSLLVALSHSLTRSLQFVLSFAWCNDVHCVLCVRMCCALSVFRKCRCWFDIDIIRLSCRPKTMWNVTLNGVFETGCTMVMQDVSINSIKPHSHSYSCCN